MKFLLTILLIIPLGLFAQTTTQPKPPVLGAIAKPEDVPSIPVAEASKHIGKTVTIVGKVFGGRFMETSSSKITILNLGGAFPNHQLAVVIPFELRGKFQPNPEDFFKDKEVAVTGTVQEFRGKPQIMLKADTDLKVVVIDVVKEKK